MKGTKRKCKNIKGNTRKQKKIKESKEANERKRKKITERKIYERKAKNH